jgi:hypothetical protein
VGSSGNVYVADYLSFSIRKITNPGTASCTVSTLAGSSSSGDKDGTGSAASFAGPRALALDAAGNVYVADSGSNSIRMVTPAGVVTTIAGNGTAGHTDGPVASATFNAPTGIALDTKKTCTSLKATATISAKLRLMA